MMQSDNSYLLRKRGCITVWLTSCYTCLDSAVLLMLINNRYTYTYLGKSKQVKQEVSGSMIPTSPSKISHYTLVQSNVLQCLLSVLQSLTSIVMYLLVQCYLLFLVAVITTVSLKSGLIFYCIKYGLGNRSASQECQYRYKY